MRDFRNLKVWEKGHRLVLEVYALTREFPAEERYELTRQLRRAAGSIPTNIAEGCGRSGDPEFRHFLSIAMGSASETEYLLILSTDLGYLSPAAQAPLLHQVQEIKRMLTPLILSRTDS